METVKMNSRRESVGLFGLTGTLGTLAIAGALLAWPLLARASSGQGGSGPTKSGHVKSGSNGGNQCAVAFGNSAHKKPQGLPELESESDLRLGLGLVPASTNEGRPEYQLVGDFSKLPSALRKRLNSLTVSQNVKILFVEMGTLEGGQRINAHTSLENGKVVARFGLHALQNLIFLEQLLAHESQHVRAYLEFLKLKGKHDKALVQLRFSNKSDHGSLPKLSPQFRSSLDVTEYKAYYEEALFLEGIAKDALANGSESNPQARSLSPQERALFQRQALDLKQLSRVLAEVTAENLRAFDEFLFQIRKGGLPVPISEVQPRFDVCEGCYEIELPFFPTTFQVRLALLMQPAVNERNQVLISGDMIVAAVKAELVDIAIQGLRMSRNP